MVDGEGRKWRSEPPGFCHGAGPHGKDFDRLSVKPQCMFINRARGGKTVRYERPEATPD
jgi:hypothetical protein